MAEPPRRTEDLPESLRDYFRSLYEAAEALLTATVRRHGLRPGLSRALAEARVALLDRHMAPIHPAMAAAGTPVACAKGCACCCTTTVEATPDEVLALADHLAASLEPAAFSALQARARAADAVGHGFASIERHRLKLFCPVLDPAGRACLGHAVRPAPCQGYLSLSLAKCEADHADPPGPIPRPEAAAMIASVVSGTRDAVLQDFGLKGGALELTAALVAAFATPDAEQRWLDGEDVFAGTEYRPSDLANFA
jgi:hypothetical protein